MSEHRAKQAEGIVTSDTIGGKQSRFFLKRLNIFITIVVLIAVGTAGGVLYKIYIYDPSHKPSTQSLNRNSNDYLLHPDKQVSAAQVELNSAKSPQQKAVAYNHLGQAYLNSAQPTNAVGALDSSLSADSSTDNKLIALNALGYAYSRAGEPDKAVATFQQIIAILQASGDASLKEGIPRYQSAIQEIQQGQAL